MYRATCREAHVISPNVRCGALATKARKSMVVETIFVSAVVRECTARVWRTSLCVPRCCWVVTWVYLDLGISWTDPLQNIGVILSPLTNPLRSGHQSWLPFCIEKGLKEWLLVRYRYQVWFQAGVFPFFPFLPSFTSHSSFLLSLSFTVWSYLRGNWRILQRVFFFVLKSFLKILKFRHSASSELLWRSRMAKREYFQKTGFFGHSLSPSQTHTRTKRKNFFSSFPLTGKSLHLLWSHFKQARLIDHFIAICKWVFPFKHTQHQSFQLFKLHCKRCPLMHTCTFVGFIAMNWKIASFPL